MTLSAYEAFKAYKEFEQARAAHSVKFLSEEPTFFWVVVALMGAKLDLKVLGKIGVKQALQTFQKSRHVKNLVDDLRRIGFSDEEIAAIRKGADNEIMGLTPQKINPELPEPPKKPAKTPKKPDKPPKKPDEPPKKVAKAEEATQATARTEPKPEAKGKRTRKPKPAKGPLQGPIIHQARTPKQHQDNVTHDLRSQNPSSNVGTQVKMEVTGPNGQKVTILIDNTVPTNRDTIRFVDAKFSETTDLTTASPSVLYDLTEILTEKELIVFNKLMNN